MKASEIIIGLRYHCEVNHFEVPSAIEIGEKMAKQLRDELEPMIRYGDRSLMANNEMKYMGIRILAPHGFHWGR